jgi:hypothetical protein
MLLAVIICLVLCLFQLFFSVTLLKAMLVTLFWKVKLFVVKEASRTMKHERLSET